MPRAEKALYCPLKSMTQFLRIAIFSMPHDWTPSTLRTAWGKMGVSWDDHTMSHFYRTPRMHLYVGHHARHFLWIILLNAQDGLVYRSTWAPRKTQNEVIQGLSAQPKQTLLKKKKGQLRIVIPASSDFEAIFLTTKLCQILAIHIYYL